ncbi:MAG: NlpC/P60 family protein [Smithella sp.]|jgi:cell wall-associated NlpC family hydrolase
MEKVKKNSLSVALFLIVVLLLQSCASRGVKVQPVSPRPQKRQLAMMGYTIQAGAFAQVENAVRLTDKLKGQGLDATYFKAADGLFKVRFGNFSSKEKARLRAQSLQSMGVIEAFYVVLPEDSAVAKRRQYGDDYLRESLVKSARDFIGVPYLWGGASAETGFDCSGLTMTVYQLNGLDLPRHSRTQYDAGDTIDRSDLKKGDLVFFATSGRGKVSHVGIYIGNGQFIHAPSRGKKIRIDSLTAEYFVQHYVGAKKYF